LAELNSRGEAQQFKFADELTFRSPFYNSNSDELDRSIGKVIKERGYDGLVNMRTIVGNFSPGTTHIISYHGDFMFEVSADLIFVEGTPIIRVRE